MDYTNMTTEEVSAILTGAYDELARRETLARTSWRAGAMIS